LSIGDLYEFRGGNIRLHLVAYIGFLFSYIVDFWRFLMKGYTWLLIIWIFIVGVWAT